MMPTILEQLKSLSTVVADTGDKSSILALKPSEITTNPTLLLKAALLKENEPLLRLVIEQARKEIKSNNQTEILSCAADLLSVEIGSQLLGVVPGRVSTEVDARLSYNTTATIHKAERLIDLYRRKNISKERILIKIAATYEGILAAKQLEEQGIHCNVTLIFDLYQSVACAEAKVTLISPFVGRILDWYKFNHPGVVYSPELDPGVVATRKTYNYLKHYGYKTSVMAASFRNIEQIIELAGCDLMTIAPQFLQELSQKEGVLERKLSIENAASMDFTRIDSPLEKKVFNDGLLSNTMAATKLQEGIDGFIDATKQLEAILANYLI